MLNYGLYLTGKKKEILLLIDSKIEDEKTRVNKLTSEHQVHTGFDYRDPNKPIPLHTPKPITNDYSDKILDLISAQAKEQLADAPDDQTCSISFQVTVHKSPAEELPLVAQLIKDRLK